jgi:hypothetical protein
MSRFSDLAAKIASEYIESTGLEGYSIRAEDMAHEFADKAGEIRICSWHQRTLRLQRFSLWSVT